MTNIDNNEIRIGIIGSGFMGRTYSECVSRYIPGGRLAAVAGGQRAPQLALDYEVDFVASVDDLIKREDVEAIIITTPEMVHLEQTQMAAAAGKHILVEKPMAPDVAQCKRMIEGCRQADVTLMVIQSQRFRGVNQRACQLLNEGRIGAVRQIRHWLLRPIQNSLDIIKARPFYLDPTGGGLYMGFAVHSFDMVRWLASSEARSVFAQVTSPGDHNVPNLGMMAHITFNNGVMAQVWLNAEMPDTPFLGSGFSTQVVGEKGLLDFDSYAHLKMASGNGWEQIWEQPSFDPQNPQSPVRLEAYTNMVQEFINAIREKRQPSVTGEDGQAAIELCQAALLSADTGQPVSLPLEII